MNEEQAIKLAHQFPYWVTKLLRESAAGSTQTIRWFIMTLYAKGYEINKKGGP